MAEPRIFISYRRDDSAGHAGRLCDRLEEVFGKDRIFRDVEDIAAGDDFVETLRGQVDRCEVLLALIGPRWLGVTDREGRPGCTTRTIGCVARSPARCHAISA